MVKRVLVCSVGGSPEPIVNAVKQNGADHVVFLCSTGGGAAASDRTITEPTTRRVSVTCPACKKTTVTQEAQQAIAARAGVAAGMYEVVSVADPDDFREVIAACGRIAEAIAARFPDEDVEVIANYTGGTKTMTAALVAFALRQPAWVCQANVAARTDLIAVRAGDVALPQDVSTLQLADVRALADGLMERADFAGALDVATQTLVRMTLSASERAPLRALRARAKVMAAWDAFDHAAALRHAEALGPAGADDVKRLKVILRARALLVGAQPWGAKDVAGVELVDDLLDNVRRCERRGRYDDAVGRLYRATELLAQVRLRRAHDLRTGDVELARAPEAARRWLEAHRDHTGKVKVGLVASYALLRDLGDALGRWYGEPANEAALREFLTARNASLFAHGIEPVDAETWGRIGARWIAWLRDASAFLRPAGPSTTGA